MGFSTFRNMRDDSKPRIAGMSLWIVCFFWIAPCPFACFQFRPDSWEEERDSNLQLIQLKKKIYYLLHIHSPSILPRFAERNNSRRFFALLGRFIRGANFTC